jgi:DNA-binding YbaB/EbfC family protein
MSILDALKNMGNLPEMMRKAQEMKGKMAAMQDELARRTFSADAGGGMIEATVNGKLELIKLKIDKTKLDPTDTEMLEDLTVAAVHAAQTKAMATIQQEMQKMTADLGLPPGMMP